MLIPDFYPATGGAERQCLKLSQELIKQGVDVAVMTRAAEPGQEGVSKVENVRVERLGSIRPFEAAVVFWFLKIWRRRKKFDVLHVHMVNEHTFGAVLAGRMANKPVLVKFANSGEYFDVRRILTYGRKPMNWLIAQSLRYVDRFVSITDAITNDIEKHGYDTGKIEIIPNGVESIARLNDREKLIARRNLGIPEDRLVFLRVGSFLPKKGVSLLCAAWDTVHRKHRNCYLVSVGGSEIPAEIEDFSRKYKDSSMFVFEPP